MFLPSLKKRPPPLPHHLPEEETDCPPVRMVRKQYMNHVLRVVGLTQGMRSGAVFHLELRCMSHTQCRTRISRTLPERTWAIPGPSQRLGCHGDGLRQPFWGGQRLTSTETAHCPPQLLKPGLAPRGGRPDRSRCQEPRSPCAGPRTGEAPRTHMLCPPHLPPQLARRGAWTSA